MCQHSANKDLIRFEDKPSWGCITVIYKDTILKIQQFNTVEQKIKSIKEANNCVKRSSRRGMQVAVHYGISADSFYHNFVKEQFSI